MKPLKRKDIVSQVAKEMNLSIEDVDNIVYYYYSYVNNLIDSLEHERINIDKLGVFKLRLNYSKKRIKDFEFLINNLEKRKQTMSIYSSIQKYKYRIDKLQARIDEVEELIKRKKKLKAEKYESNRTVEKKRDDI